MITYYCNSYYCWNMEKQHLSRFKLDPFLVFPKVIAIRHTIVFWNKGLVEKVISTKPSMQRAPTSVPSLLTRLETSTKKPLPLILLIWNVFRFQCFCFSPPRWFHRTLENAQEFLGSKKKKISTCLSPLAPFHYVSFFSSSSKSKFINHLPADKISCLMGEQLLHLVGSCDEKCSSVSLPPPLLPAPCQTQHTCRSNDKARGRLIFSRLPFKIPPGCGGGMLADLKSVLNSCHIVRYVHTWRKFCSAGAHGTLEKCPDTTCIQQALGPTVEPLGLYPPQILRHVSTVKPQKKINIWSPTKLLNRTECVSLDFYKSYWVKYEFLTFRSNYLTSSFKLCLCLLLQCYGIIWKHFAERCFWVGVVTLNYVHTQFLTHI